MTSKKIQNNIFSEKTFELISEWFQDYYDDPNAIDEFEESNIFDEYVASPFLLFCEEVARRLPPYFSINMIAKDKTYTNQSEDYELCLKAYFTKSALLFVEITQWGINTGIDHEVYQEIIQKASQKNPQELINLLSKNPAFFVNENPLYIDRDDILYNIGLPKSVNKVIVWFRKYLPLIILATCDDPIPVINYLSNPELYLYSLDWDKTGFTDKELQCWLRAINRKGQAIIYGSPGTGKTFIAQRLAENLVGKYGFIELVQFHPAYTYEDFIQGIRPQSENGKLTYPLVPGRFLEFCKKAESFQDICVLIIDEINRANLPQVFGELMYLLEYRDQEIPLAGGNKFRIPQNVRIIGTMNTADRSIAQIDHALRRRFAFIELRPNYDVLIKYHLNTGFAVMGLINVLKQLNQAIDDKNYEVGISFFLTPNLTEDIEDIWKMEIEPYLEEYFFNNLEKLNEFRWDKIQKDLKI
ncbi:MAG: AAA family ATPase [Nostocales cyanobacterium]|nr:MAG: AAA family ATPase [Nostocales cyanobacterium]